VEEIQRNRPVCPFNIPTCTGCQGSNGTASDGHQRLQHETIFWRAVTNIYAGQVSSPGLVRDQLHQAYIDTYFSPGMLGSYPMYRQIIRASYGRAQRSMAMKASCDALSLVHLGSRHKDERLVKQGQVRYCAALRCIHEALLKPHAARDDSVLGACYTIANCEVRKVHI